MPPFLQFRLWLREGSTGERVLAASAGAIFVVLLVLASLPLADGGGSAADYQVEAGAGASSGIPSSANTIAGTAGATDDNGANGTVGPGGGESGSATPDAAASIPSSGAGGEQTVAAPVDTEGSSSGDAGSHCSSVAASAPGITKDEVRIAAPIVNLAGPVGNEAFDLRPDMHEIVQALTAEINETGGLACGRKLVVKSYDVNPLDQNDQQRKCLQIVQDQPFVVVDFAGYVRAPARACFVQNKVPFQLMTLGTEAEFADSYPFIYGLPGTAEAAMANVVHGADELGYFTTPKFQKIGLLVDSCVPEATVTLEAHLAKVGVKRNQISKFTVSCQLVAPPSEIVQAVVQHKAAGATHVFLGTSLSNSQRYVQIARQQNFRAEWSSSDYGTLVSSDGWDPWFGGAIGVTGFQTGELNDGIRNPQVVECDRVLRKHGLQGIEKPEDRFALLFCDQFAFFRAAVDNADANPSRRSFVENGVGTVGHFEASGWPDGLFDQPGKVHGGDFRRSVRFDGDCPCWKLRGDQRDFKRGF